MKTAFWHNLPSGGGKQALYSHPLLGELHRDELRAAKALDEHRQECAEEINRKGFDPLLGHSSIIQAVSSIGSHVKNQEGALPTGC